MPWMNLGIALLYINPRSGEFAHFLFILLFVDLQFDCLLVVFQLRQVSWHSLTHSQRTFTSTSVSSSSLSLLSSTSLQGFKDLYISPSGVEVVGILHKAIFQVFSKPVGGSSQLPEGARVLREPVHFPQLFLVHPWRPRPARI